MTRPAKRPATTFDDRASPPKRRKTAERAAKASKDSTRDTGKEEEKELGGSSQATHDSDEQWPAIRILDERRERGKIDYYIEWEPNPVDDEPSWVRSSISALVPSC